MNDVESRDVWEGRRHKWLADTVGPRTVDGVRQDFHIFHDLGEDDLPSLAQIEQQYDVPASTELISVTTRLVAPGVALFGTDRQRERFLRPLLRTDVLACQRFSEPGAGSDLAGLSCRATRTEQGSWRVTG